ncbi:lipopolysaccharide transport periplasmic protein LptA [Massilia arenosa]|uniref:Lipopolysaccharide export system protein LptA n=1 Tax=Zemynaea arenosa TaxID=2561931 RepID=A0A4Y9S9K2_9BURK|nr:lipopolysaccharide transport periplasmic protein LptA [Massilia arenosa]TFW18393.1 lipopolysaccharide transport periplasmic protein LptA [Massilia arenosa]
MTRTPIRATCALMLALAAAAAHAERADALKPIHIVGNNKGNLDLVEGTSSLTGNVVLTRGTLTIKAEQVTVRQDDQGYTYATFIAAPGGKATFRQKRDGGTDLWSEGEAQRIEYDEKADLVKFIANARVASLEGSKVTSQAAGPFLSYDSRKEVVQALNTPEGKSQVGGSRVEIVIDRTRRPAPVPAQTPAPSADQGKK